jgi:1,3-beta-glucan synthase
MQYPNPPPPPKHQPSVYSTTSSNDPFGAQTPYDPNAPPLPYGNNPYGGPNPGAGGAGVAPPMQGGQYAPYYDTDSEMAARYDGGGRGRETWASDSGSGYGEVWSRNCRGVLLTGTDAGNYPPSSESYHGGQPGYIPSRASTPTFTEGSKEGHRPREPYVSCDHPNL